MSEANVKMPGARVKRIRAALIVIATCATAACSGETPVTPPVSKQLVVAPAGEKNFSFSISPADRTMRVRFTRVRSDGCESVSAFMQRMFASADSAGVNRLIVDLRSNTGGDAFLLVPLVKGVVARERFARRGGLVVLLGPGSVSRNQNVEVVLEQYANPTILRELPRSTPVL